MSLPPQYLNSIEAILTSYRNNTLVQSTLTQTHNMSAQEEQIPIQDESVQDSNVDAQAEDEVASSGSEQKQIDADASELDESNILDNSPGVKTRGAKVDATKQVSFSSLIGLVHDALSISCNC